MPTHCGDEGAWTRTEDDELDECELDDELLLLEDEELDDECEEELDDEEDEEEDEELELELDEEDDEFAQYLVESKRRSKKNIMLTDIEPSFEWIANSKAGACKAARAQTYQKEDGAERLSPFGKQQRGCERLCCGNMESALC
jgi:hypothetical protein